MTPKGVREFVAHMVRCQGSARVTPKGVREFVAHMVRCPDWVDDLDTAHILGYAIKIRIPKMSTRQA